MLKPKGVTRMPREYDKTEREHARNSLGPLPRGYCEQKTLNLEKTSSSVLSVLLLLSMIKLFKWII